MNAQMNDKDRIAFLEAQLAAVKAAQNKRLSFKVTAKKPDGTGTDGALSVYGLGRFPITLYRGQWERLISAIPELQTFIRANEQLLTVKL